MKIVQGILVLGFFACVFGEEIAPKIVGGQVASLGQFPHSVLIARRRLQFTNHCSGSLIRFNWVLTSASCVTDFYEIELSFGTVARNATPVWQTTIIEATHVRPHENYNPQTLVNDIALILIQNAQPSLLDSAYVGIVSLPTPSIPDLTSRTATVSGFGWTSSTAGSGSNELRFIDVPIVSDVTCLNAVGANFNDTVLCTSTTGGMGTCRDDTGSGLVTAIETLITLIGVSTFDDCNLVRPSVFTRVSTFNPWINRVINEMITTTTVNTQPTTPPTTTTTTTTESSGKQAIKMAVILNFAIILKLIF